LFNRKRGKTVVPPVPAVPPDNRWGLAPLSVFDTNFFLTMPIIRSVMFFFRFVGWKLIDVARAIKEQKEGRAHLYGIWCFVGLPGAGKTMSMVRYLDDMRRQYGDSIIIITNFFYAGQDAHLTGWDELKQRYDKPVIYAWDELQNEFNCRKTRDFPLPLVRELSQNRKGHGKQIVYTTQDYGWVDLNFRRLTSHVVDCRTLFGRLTMCRYYTSAVFEHRREAKSVTVKVKQCRPYKKDSFIQSDYLRSRYDSFQRLDYLADMDYEHPPTSPVRSG
jgi:ATP-dependent Clp protease ATP-binding subunit ClpX